MTTEDTGDYTDPEEQTDEETRDAATDPDAGQRGPDEGDTGASPADRERTGGRDVVPYLEWGGLAGLGLVALVAVFRFYFAASRAIGIWISPDFEPLFQAAFNIVVLLFAAAGIAVFARRLR